MTFSHLNPGNVIRYAGQRLDCPLVLGCMRPRGNPELELAAVENGISAIVMPHPETRRRLEETVDVKRENVCCALIGLDKGPARTRGEGEDRGEPDTSGV